MTDTDISPEAVERLCSGSGPKYRSIAKVNETLRALSAALTQSRAETAAVIERAAQEVDCGGCRGDCPMPATCCARDAASIRAIATPDQSSALAAVEAAAEARGMWKAAEICAEQTSFFASQDYTTCQPLSSFSERFAYKTCQQAILIAIPHGDASND